MKQILTAGVLAMFATTHPALSDEVTLHAAGSLKAAMTDIADAFEATTDMQVARNFGPSGLLRERIEGGEHAEVFASANMRHPQTLADAALAGDVTMFARNSLCGLAQQDIAVSSDTILDVMLSPDTRLGTSTPKADPSGDYAWQLFDKADAIAPGSTETLKSKALQLTGGPNSATPPEGRNPYGWVMSEDQADLFLTYCTNAVLAQRDTPGLQIVQLPEALAVGADYGLTVINGASAAADDLAAFVTGPDAQKILSSYGFKAPD
ncbi:molybdate ABC transporter substrate-binding protein [Aliiroseovarius sediminis]|uniref:molybdate ABC transporter substrate-binding protein n=1 Tax=Aliiroseovarius sediminis TaxID=2925839 RepID=UPI001F57BDC6|nr:molybdate ABC transporter substrate-binding protein [Aliiroseovarius sediminis]MCI2393760.1 molybdate ABC transporter substrate-binding protein [Aliiroseovarius sediminis]